jgi:3-deoxy-D-manno-octulosonic acid (KDO) 8-phosphate synthase
VSENHPLLPSAGTCFVDAIQTQFHKNVPSLLRAPLLGSTQWRVSGNDSDKMMDRRGWVQSVCTTVTTPEQIFALPESCERIFIPGEFCRQGDVLAAATASKKIILLERGAFLAPSDLTRAVEKLGEAKSSLILVEAGSSFGYSDRVLDPRALEIMLSLNCPLALNLNALVQPSGAAYEHRPLWMDTSHFDIAFVRTALAFQAQYLFLPVGREIAPAALELWMSAIRKQS